MLSPLSSIEPMLWPKIHSHFHGRKDYQESLQIQAQAVSRVREEKSWAFILGFEYEAVITLGRRAKSHEEVKRESQIPQVLVERGGLATLHSPGQLVIYPVCNIRVLEQTPKNWVQGLLKITKQTIKHNSPPSTQKHLREDPFGLYLGSRKVTSIGLRISQGVSSFGLAIHLKNDPSLFSNIRPCGREQEVGNLSYEGSLEEFFSSWCQEFKKAFLD